MAIPIRSKAVHSGRNRDLGTYRDDRYVRCNNCGFMCNLDRDRRAPRGSRLGDGISETSIYDNNWSTTHWGTKAWDSTDEDPVVVSGGCPLCGKLMYDE